MLRNQHAEERSLRRAVCTDGGAADYMLQWPALVRQWQLHAGGAVSVGSAEVRLETGVAGRAHFDSCQWYGCARR